jgi:hypothetical protein
MNPDGLLGPLNDRDHLPLELVVPVEPVAVVDFFPDRDRLKKCCKYKKSALLDKYPIVEALC